MFIVENLVTLFSLARVPGSIEGPRAGPWVHYRRTCE